MSVRRTILSSVAGAAAAAFSAAALLGVPTYLSNDVGFLGRESNFALVVAFEGFAYGIIPGAVIGFVVGVRRAHPLIGGIIGIGVGFLNLLVWLTLGMTPGDQIFLWTIEYIPICGVIGLVIAPFNYRGVPAPPKSLDRSAGKRVSQLA